MIRHRSILTTFAVMVCVVLCAGCGDGTQASPKAATSEAAPTPSHEPSAAQNKPSRSSRAEASSSGSEPAHLRDALAVLDLRAIEVPKDTETAHGDATSVTIVAPISVADAYKFYVTQLEKAGWTESNEPGSKQVAEEYAQSIFNKQGYRISLFIHPGDTSTGMANIVLRNHGNLDTRQLPAPQGSKVLFGSQSSTMLVTDLSVADAVEACRDQLRAAGWLEFGPAGTQRAANADNAQLTFRKRGAELSAFVAVAPAQGSKTTIQYSTQLLPGELPWPDSAEQVEFDPKRMLLTCQTSASFAEVVDYYRTGLPPLGWTYRDDLDQIRDDYGALYFDDEEKNRLLVILDRRDAEATKIKVEHVSAAVLAELERREGEIIDNMTADEPMIEKAAISARSLPVPATASDVQYDSLSEEIRYDATDSVESLIEFYRDGLGTQQWTEDRKFTVITNNVGSMTMRADDARLSFTLIHTGLDDKTQVRINASGLNWDADPADIAGNEPASSDDDSPVPTAAELVAEDKNGFPIPSNNTGYEAQNTNFRKQAVATIPASLTAVIEFYRSELPGYEWQEIADEAQIDGQAARLVFQGTTGRLDMRAETAGSAVRVELATKDEAAARRAGILPEPGTARIIVGNMTDSPASMTVGGKSASLKPNEGKNKPDGPSFSLAPGDYRLEAKVGAGGSVVEQIQVGPDETWAVLLSEEGILPLRMY